MVALLISLLAIVVLAILSHFRQGEQPVKLVKSGRVEYLEYCFDTSQHSGSILVASQKVWRTAVFFEDGYVVLLRRRGKLSWPAGTELTISERAGREEFSVEPSVDYSPEEPASRVPALWEFM